MVATLTAPPGRVSPGVAPRSSRAWLTLGVLVVARAYRAFLLTLAVVAVLPVAWSWSSYLVTSGSMEPSFSIGDVVVAAPLSQDATIPIGRVMVFTNPAKPTSGVPLVHRVVAAAGHHRYTTAGDANAADDTMPAARRLFRAQARILVPYVGLPLIWWRTGQLLLLTSWLIATAAAFVVSSRPRRWWRRRGSSPRRPLHGHRAVATVQHSAEDGRVRRIGSFWWPSVHGLGVGVALTAIALTSATASASFSFSSSTRNGSNTWTVSSTLTNQPYTVQVLADAPYLYYLLDEASGTTAADSAGSNRTGSYTAVTSYHQSGALAHNFGYSIGLAGGQGRVVSGGAALSNPANFTLELWFRTSTGAGGKLIGFESTQNATSPTADRHLFMRPDGHIVYGGWSGTNTGTIVSPAAYNDGAWHYLALTAKPNGNKQDSVLYLDGASVVAGLTTDIAKYAGWWRVGYGTLPTGVGFPTSASFTGQIDNAAVYQNPLTAARIAAHYAAR